MAQNSNFSGDMKLYALKFGCKNPGTITVNTKLLAKNTMKKSIFFFFLDPPPLKKPKKKSFLPIKKDKNGLKFKFFWGHEALCTKIWV